MFAASLLPRNLLRLGIRAATPRIRPGHHQFRYRYQPVSSVHTSGCVLQQGFKRSSADMRVAIIGQSVFGQEVEFNVVHDNLLLWFMWFSFPVYPCTCSQRKIVHHFKSESTEDFCTGSLCVLYSTCTFNSQLKCITCVLMCTVQ